MRPSPTDRSHDDNWSGGFYELSIKLGDADDARLEAALIALWQATSLPAPFRRDSDEPVQVTAEALLAGHLHAVATIPGLGSTLCTVLVVREETYDSEVTQYGADWLDLCLPLGALCNLDERVGAYPFTDGNETRGWRKPIEDWFTVAATAVFQRVPFLHAVTGDEVSGLEPSKLEPGRLGIFTPDSNGGLKIEPVSLW